MTTTLRHLSLTRSSICSTRHSLTPPSTIPGTDTYRTNDLLIKQTYSVHYRPEVLEGLHPQDPPRKWHLGQSPIGYPSYGEAYPFPPAAYHSHGTIDSLADVTSIPDLDGLHLPPGLVCETRVGKRKEGNSLPLLPSQNPTHAELAGAPTPYSPPSSVFTPLPPAPCDPPADLAQRNPRDHAPSRRLGTGKARNEWSLPTPAKPLQQFLLRTYLVAVAMTSWSLRLPAFRVQIRHLSLQALGLVVQLNDEIDPEEGPTEEQYDEAFYLDE